MCSRHDKCVFCCDECSLFKYVCLREGLFKTGRITLFSTSFPDGKILVKQCEGWKKFYKQNYLVTCRYATGGYLLEVETITINCLVTYMQNVFFIFLLLFFFLIWAMVIWILSFHCCFCLVLFCLKGRTIHQKSCFG